MALKDMLVNARSFLHGRGVRLAIVGVRDLWRVRLEGAST